MGALQLGHYYISNKDNYFLNILSSSCKQSYPGWYACQHTVQTF